MRKNKRFPKEWFQLRGTLLAPSETIGPIMHVERFDSRCIVYFQNSVWEVNYTGKRKNTFKYIKFNR